ncbi:replication-relaxation family protein [Embleya sp. NPDC127516]|uniref:replication-relaxation family protein n=1 Tax=Embleya sp. NPDC127516 TaxID=3363990 RepID=UPI00380939D6
MAALGCVRVATLAQLRELLTPGHASTAYVRRVTLTQEERGLVARVRHGRTDVWHLTRAGQATITASGAPHRPRAATGEAALRGGLAAHALALALAVTVTVTAAACVRHRAGPITGWDVEVEHRLERR